MFPALQNIYSVPDVLAVMAVVDEVEKVVDQDLPDDLWEVRDGEVKMEAAEAEHVDDVLDDVALYIETVAFLYMDLTLLTNAGAQAS